MEIINIIDIHIFSFLVLIVIFVDLLNKFDKNSFQDKLFLALLVINVIVIVFEVINLVINKVNSSYLIIINALANVIIFYGTTLIEALWIFYIDYQIYHDENRIRRYTKPISAVLAIYLFMVVISPFTGWFFYINKENDFSRGNLYFIHILINFIFIAYAFYFIISRRKIIKKNYFWALFLFTAPPVIFAIIQILYYGLELIWAGITLSILIVYFNIQNNTMNIDYLTGAYNRKKLDKYIKEKISESSENKTFSAIIIDLNDFKQINDNYGHPVGDMALKNTVKLVKGIMRHSDFIARYGGDEFIIIMESYSEEELIQTVAQIECAVIRHNETHTHPYKVSFCMGYAVYDYKLKMSASDFIKHIDGLMYENKKIFKLKYNS